MKVLIVDDQYDVKVKAATAILRELEVGMVKHVMSSFDACKEMLSEQFDLIIVDLHIPERLGDEVSIDGGRSLLRRLELDSKLKKPTAVLALTAQREAYEQHKDFFTERGWPLLLDSDGSGLRSQLSTLLRTQLAHLQRNMTECDIFIVTALAHTELEAVLAAGGPWERLKVPGRPEIFHRCKISDKDANTRTIIATNLPSMGLTPAAVVSAYACNIFKPKYILMTGIAAGVPGKVNLGDIMIASPSWDWGSGKLTIKDGAPHFLSSPSQIPLDQELHALLSGISADKRYVSEIAKGWKGPRPATELCMKVGPMASGAVVLEDPSTVDLIKSQNRATIGIEMEAYGVMSAAYYGGANGPKCIVIKSVCDFADPHKNDEWQNYAAYTSVAFAFALMNNELDYG